MGYIPKTWTTGELATAADANHWESQYDCVFDASAKTFAGAVAVTGVLAANGGITGTTGAFSSTLSASIITASGGVLITGGTFDNGKIYRDSTNGILIIGTTGSVYDFVVFEAAGSVPAIGVPAGTNRLRAPGTYNNTSASAANVYIDSNGLLHRSTSSARYKDDVRPFDGGLADILRLQPKSFVSLTDPNGPRYLGFLAEDFDKAGLYSLVIYDDRGRPDAVQYDRLTTYLVNGVRELAAEVSALRAAARMPPLDRRPSTLDVESRDRAIAQERARSLTRETEREAKAFRGRND